MHVKRLFSVILLLVVGVALVHADPKKNDEPTDLNVLYQQIDEAISQSPQYVAERERQIDACRNRLMSEKDVEKSTMIAEELFLLYQPYKNDSALHYAEVCISLADSLHRKDLVGRFRSMLAYQCSNAGMYTESLEQLHLVKKSALDQKGLCEYYNARMHVYGELGYYSIIPPMKEQYFRQQTTYRDSLFALVDHQAPDYLMYRIQELKGRQQLDEGRKVSDQWVKRVDPESREFAIACYYRWLVSDDPDEMRYWIAQSALSDVRHAVMDQASLLSLADLLNADGDLDRSYRYIRFTWDCNNRFNTRMRSWQITPILNVIERNYQGAVEHNTKVLRMSIIVVSILALLLLGVLFFLHRRNRQLDTARNDLKISNEELAGANRQLATQTEELAALNGQLSMVNGQLTESNRVKEEYIGRFMSLCSQYIDKLDNYRKMVNKKMKNKELDELFRISKSTELKEHELEELLQNFDSVFLHLFPDFVEEFNALLQPEMQIRPKEDNRLTTELRIFALIRLGIEDSSKIAEFLHYSVNTIYNYRARIKNGATNSRESFERRVKKLGLI